MYTLAQFLERGRIREESPFFSSSALWWGRSLQIRITLLCSIFFLLALALSFSLQLKGLSYFFLSVVYLLTGTPALIDSIRQVGSLSFTIDLLMTCSAYGALYIGQPFEGALLLLLFYSSHAVEEWVGSRSQGAMRDFRSLSPQRAHWVRQEGEIVDRSVKDLAVGEKIWVRSGEVVPLDGRVLQGSSLIQIAHLTGESYPIKKEAGDFVPSGAHLLEGSLTLAIEKKSADSTVSQMIELISQAQKSRPQLQIRIQRGLSRYSLVILSLSAFIIILLPLFSSIPYGSSSGSLYRGLAFLIGTSPCALVISTPIAYLSALTSAFRRGIFLKGGALFDRLREVSSIVFDKTGTLTTGQLELCQMFSHSFLTSAPLSPKEREKLFSQVASLEQSVVHPLAEAIVAHAQKRNLALHTVDEVSVEPGRGVRGVFCKEEECESLYVGSYAFVRSFLSEERQKASDHLVKEWGIERDGKEKMWVYAWFKESFLVFSFIDLLRAECQEVIETLQEQYQLTPHILSGDQPSHLSLIAAKLGISSFWGAVCPEEKLAKVAQLSDEGGAIMVGDGINDAAALARATVGIAMGKEGDTTTIRSADIVLLNNQLDSLCWLLARARRVRQVVRQNLCISCSIIALVAFFSLRGTFPLWSAVLLHEGGTLCVGFNGLRLLKK